MFTSVIALILVLLGAFGLSGLTRRRAEECLPLVFCGIIGILYGFYCFGAVRLGLFLVIVGCLALFLAGRRWKLTPGISVYLGLCGLFLVFFSGNTVVLHDELRLWAAVPRALHETGKLQLGGDAIVFTTMQSYPPGLPLLDYFFTAFSSAFSEGALYVGYCCFAMSFLVPALSRWEWKQWPLLAPVGLFLLLMVCFFTSNSPGCLFGKALFVDPLLGIASGYLYFLSGRRPFQDDFSAAQFCLTLLVVCLLKSTGVVFGAAALVTALMLEPKLRSWRLLLPLGAVLASVGGWRFLLMRYSVQVLKPLTLHRLSGRAITNVLRALVSEGVIAYRVPLDFLRSSVFVMAVLFGLYYGAWRLEKGLTRRGFAVTALGIVLTTAAFVYGYALIYGETMESFPRYMSTPLLCLSSCAALTALPLLTLEKVTDWLGSRSRAWSIRVSCGAVGVSILFLIVWSLLFPRFDLRGADADAQKIRAAVMQDGEFDHDAGIYLVMAGDGWENSLHHHRIFFDMISPELNIHNGMAQTQVVIPGVEDPTARWAEQLRSGFDYVYILTLEEALVPVFGELSEDEPVEGGLYRVVLADTQYGVTLERV